MKKVFIYFGLIILLNSIAFADFINIDGNKALANTLRIRFKNHIYHKAIAEMILFADNITIKDQYLKPEQSLTFKVSDHMSIQTNSNQILIAEDPILRSYIIEYKQNSNPIKFAKYLLNKYPEIEIAEPYIVDQIQSVNDPLTFKQNLLSTIKANEAWNIFPGSSNIVIAISDNGVEQNHEDIIGNIAVNTAEIPNNNIDDDGNGFVDDYIGYNMSYKDDGTLPGNTSHNMLDHGSEVTGIAAATTNNSLGIAGIGNQCKLFPIKTAINNSSDIVYGYQSLIYAALRGFQVVNCSWGTHKSFSQIDQSIIDFAVAKGLMVVSAAGNNGFNVKLKTDIYYPANYRGVLGVGEVNQYDNITAASRLGVACKIFAPGDGNYTTQGSGIYGNVGEGTSYASPVMAGAMGLAKGKFPELNSYQLIQYVRQCTDDISEKNLLYKNLCVGRINLYKMLNGNPNSIPGFEFLNYSLKSNTGTIQQKLFVGDTANMTVNLHNWLAASNNLTFTLSTVEDYSNSVKIINNKISGINAQADKDLSLNGFQFKITTRNPEKIFFRLDITTDNYSDFILFEFTPSTEIITFANDVISFSVDDNGKIGFGGTDTNKEGVGITYKKAGNQIYKAGIMATENDEKLVSSFNGWGNNDSDFRYSAENSANNLNKIIINDSNTISSEFIGLNISQEFSFPDKKVGIAKVKVTVKNTSGTTLNNIAVGYLFDWDLGFDSDSNSVRYFPEAIPSTLGNRGAAEISEYKGKNFPTTFGQSTFPVFGCLVGSDVNKSIGQAAGYSYETTYDFQKSDQIASLSSGSTIQYNEINDISMVIGQNFPGSLNNNQEYTFYLYFGAAETSDNLATLLKKAYMNEPLTDVDEDLANLSIIYPNPANDFIEITLNNSNEVFIYNQLGDLVKKYYLIQNSQNSNTRIDISNIPSGIYFIKIGNSTYKLIKI